MLKISPRDSPSPHSQFPQPFLIPRGHKAWWYLKYPTFKSHIYADYSTDFILKKKTTIKIQELKDYYLEYLKTSTRALRDLYLKLNFLEI